MENANGAMQRPRGWGRESRRVYRDGGTDSNSCETTMVSNRHYRTLVPWAHMDTILTPPLLAAGP